MSAAFSLAPSVPWRRRALLWLAPERRYAPTLLLVPDAPDLEDEEEDAGRALVSSATASHARTGRRVYLSDEDVATVLVSGIAPDARVFELDAAGRALVTAWSAAGRPEPVEIETKKAYVRPSRAKPRDATRDERVARPLSKEDQKRALEILAKRFVRPEHLDKRRCLTCAKGFCRCSWRTEVWLELVMPLASIEVVDDLELRTKRAAQCVESRNRRQWGNRPWWEKL